MNVQSIKDRLKNVAKENFRRLSKLSKTETLHLTTSPFSKIHSPQTQSV